VSLSRADPSGLGHAATIYSSVQGPPGVETPTDKLWLLVGDFNLIRWPEDRNKARGDINLMLKFNEAISNLDLVEIPLHGLSYTWSNRQREPLL
jgi:hypothetical protein